MIGWATRTFAPNVLVWACVGLLAWGAAGWGVAGVQSWRIDRLKAAPVKAENRALRGVRRVERAQAEAGSAVEAATERVRVEYRDRYVTQILEIPDHVTPETDRRYPLSVGFVRVLDAAAAGADLSATPGPAGLADDAASDVAPSHAAGVIVGNYAGCTDDRAKLLGLQAWVLQTQAAAAATPGD